MNYAVTPPFLLRKFYNTLTWNFPTEEKIIYLTFDDGPVPGITPFVLDQLKKFNAKGTFFCTGENVEKHPEIFQEIKKQGHAAGNHTYNHLNGWKTKDHDYVENVERANVIIESKLFRPPYGRIKKSQIKLLTSPTPYSIIMWDVLSNDFDNKVSREQCLKNVTQYAKKGSIVVFHDSEKAKENLFYALPKTLEHFSKLGFEFRKIKEQ